MSGGLLPPLILELRAKAGEALAEMKEVGHEAENVGDHARSGGAKAQAAYNKLAGIGKAALMGIAGASVAVGVEAFKMADEMSESDAHIAGSAQISVRAAQGIGDAFLKTAGDSTFSGKQMADAFGPVAGVVQQLSGHALNAADSLKFMASANDLAEATGEPLQQVTATLAQTMQAYGLKLGDAAEASNTMFNISRLTGVGISELGSTVQKLHGRLGVAAPDLTSVGALMLDLQKHGIAGSRGVMVAQTALTTLLAGSKKTSTELKALGISVFDSSGKFVGMQTVLSALEPKLAKMTDAQRLQAETALFGASAGTAMNGTVMAGAQAYAKATVAVSAHDAVQKAAEASANSLHGQIDKLKAGFSDIVTLLGEKLVPIVTSVVTWFTKHKTVTIALAGVIAGVLTAAITAYVSKLVWGSAQTVGRIAVMVAGWAGLGPAAAAAGAETEAAMDGVMATEDALAASSEATGVAASAAFGPIGLAIGAVIVAAVLLATHWKQVWGFIKTVASDAWNDVLKPVFNFIENYAIRPVVAAAQYMARVFTEVWSAISGAVTGAWDDVIKPVFGFITQHWGLLLAGLTGGLSILLQHWHAVWDAIQAAAKFAWDDVLKPVWNAIYNDGIMTLVHGVQAWGRIFADVWDGIKTAALDAWQFLDNYVIHPIESAWNGLVQGFVDAKNILTGIFSGIWNGLETAASDVFNAVAWIWNHTLGAVNFTIPSWVPVVGGDSFGFPQMPTVSFHARGGGVGDGWFVAGENGPELGHKTGNMLSFLSNPDSQRTLLNTAGARAAGAGGGQVVEVHSHVYLDGKHIRSTVERQQLKVGQRRGKTWQGFSK